MFSVKLAHLILTFVCATAGAMLFKYLGVPAATLTGATAAVTLLALGGMDVSFSVPLRNVTILVLGINIGAAVSPEAIQAAITWPLSLGIMTFCVFASMFVNTHVLSRVFGYERETATLASAPGHLTFVLGIAMDSGRDVPAITIIQSVRVLFLTLCLPPLITLAFGATGVSVLPEQVLPLPHLALTILAAIPLAFLIRLTGLPAPWLLAGMAISALGHGTGISPGRLPDLLGQAAFVAMGALIGSRFSATRPRDVLAYLVPGLFVTLITVVIALSGALLAGWVLGLSTGLVTISFSPGAIEAMTAIAISLGYEPTFIAAHHVFRLIVLSFVMPFLFRNSR